MSKVEHASSFLRCGVHQHGCSWTLKDFLGGFQVDVPQVYLGSLRAAHRSAGIFSLSDLSHFSRKIAFSNHQNTLPENKNAMAGILERRI